MKFLYKVKQRISFAIQQRRIPLPYAGNVRQKLFFISTQIYKREPIFIGLDGALELALSALINPARLLVCTALWKIIFKSYQTGLPPDHLVKTFPPALLVGNPSMLTACKHYSLYLGHFNFALYCRVLLLRYLSAAPDTSVVLKHYPEHGHTLDNSIKTFANSELRLIRSELSLNSFGTAYAEFFSSLHTDLEDVLNTPKSGLQRIIASQGSPSELLESYFRNKTVAVVGPSTSLGLHGNEIDSTDIVVRLNHRQKLIHDPTRGGTKTHVSVFNENKSRNLSEADLNSLSCLDWVLINGSLPTSPHTTLSNMSVLPRQSSLLGELNLAPYVISFLVRCNPRSVFVFGVDLYINNCHPPGYLSSELIARAPRLLDRSFSWQNSRVLHDPILQYNFLKMYWLEGLIIPDPYLKSILDGGLTEYFRCLSCD